MTGKGWIFVLATLLSFAIFPPAAPLVGAGSALYAHRQGERGTRNVLLAITLVIVLVFGAFFLVFGAGTGTRETIVGDVYSK